MLPHSRPRISASHLCSQRKTLKWGISFTIVRLFHLNLMELIKQPIKVQLQEMKGKLEFDADKYHCTRYNDLLKKIVHLRAEYFKSRDMGARKEIAKEEFSHWLNYLEGRKEDLPMPNYSIDDKEMSQLKETFDRFKDRKTYKIASDQMTDFHSDYASKFKFKVPLHPKNMQQMIHPHFGYLCNFQNKHFSFEELIQVYNNQIISSYERTLGQELLADELACLSYWLIIDTDKKGVFDMNEFERLLQAFRFDVKPFNFANMKKEFIHTVRQNPGEFLPIENEDDHIIRFDFARRIFLDRGL